MAMTRATDGEGQQTAAPDNGNGSQRQTIMTTNDDRQQQRMMTMQDKEL